MKNYIISNNTLAILPFGDNYSIVYENNRNIVIESNPNKIIKYNCRIHGSSLEGRLKGAELLTGFTYKTPICISNNLLFFPTTSLRLKQCSWINLYNVKNVTYNKNNNLTQINFNNNIYIDFKISKNILNNQILKANLLDAKLRRNEV